eukprot:Skav236124  [mRNA]  locus=scaffold900:157689:158519:- [translate_table: standard]
MPPPEDMDCMASEYVEFLWEEGYPKAEASYALAALQFFRPQSKGVLVWAWKMTKAWSQLEMPIRATPLTPELVLSLAGQCFKWKQTRLGWLIVLGFAGMLRTTELLTLKKKDVVLPAHASPNEAVLLLPSTKSTKRCLLPLDKVVITETTGIRALQELCAGLQPGETLSQLSTSKFRRLWAQILEELGLHNQGYQPYSLRRGAATSAYRQGMTLDSLVTKGRWQHITTARIYLDQGLQSLAAIAHPPTTLRLCDKARQTFAAVSQLGAREWKRRWL